MLVSVSVGVSEGKINSFRDLKVWQAARELCREIYLLTATFPKEEIYGLTSQIRRSAISIISNIAEGSGRISTKEYIYFLSIAKGSAKEVEAQLIIAEDLKLVDVKPEIFEKIDEINKMLFGLIKALKNKT